MRFLKFHFHFFFHSFFFILSLRHMSEYDWLADRENISLEQNQIDSILSSLNLKFESIKHLTNPDGQWSVNKVFKIQCKNVNGEPKTLIIKVSHPFWNGTGKLMNEVLLNILTNFTLADTVVG